MIDAAAPVGDHARGLWPPLRFPPVPWRQRSRLAPQAPPFLPRLRFELRQNRVAGRVFPIPPAHPMPYHLAIQRASVGENDFGDGPAVSGRCRAR